MYALALLTGGIILLVVLYSILGKRFNREQEAAPEPGFNEEYAGEFAIPAENHEPENIQYPQEMELPDTYGVDRLLLLVRDPHWLYAYWEVSAAKQEELTQNYGHDFWNYSQPVLRMYELEGDNFDGEHFTEYKDINLTENDNNWHINAGKADHSFCVDLGRMLPGGKFVTVLRSNIVRTPRETLSDNLDEEWMWIEDIYRSLSRMPVGATSPGIKEKEEKVILPRVSSPGGNWQS